MWTPLNDDSFGLMKSFSDIIAKESASLPNLHTSETILVTSDYSGQHKSARYDAYSFLLATPQRKRRLELRQKYQADKRRMSFKKLGDAVKRRMLPSFLAAADMLPGICLCILVDKKIGSLFCENRNIDLTNPDLTLLADLTPDNIEKLLRIVHFVSFVVAGLSRQGQNLMWFTDQDEIAANDEGVIRLTRIWGSVLSHYLQHEVGHIRCGTTKCDNGTLQIEDLAAIPDLAAGALTELTSHYQNEGIFPTSKLAVTVPQSISGKAREIIGWLSDDAKDLRRVIFCFQASENSTKTTIQRLKLHNGSLLV